MDSSVMLYLDFHTCLIHLIHWKEIYMIIIYYYSEQKNHRRKHNAAAAIATKKEPEGPRLVHLCGWADMCRLAMHQSFTRLWYNVISGVARVGAQGAGAPPLTWTQGLC